VTIRPPKYNSQGYTLVEILVVLIIAGIMAGITVPSLLSLNKPLRDGSLQFKSQLSLIRSKAISSNKAYRLKPKYPTAAEYTGQTYQQTPHNFVVEYAANCRVTAVGGTNGWAAASQLDLDLPEAIGVATNSPDPIPASLLPVVRVGGTTPLTSLSWEICFDNRGISDQTALVTLKDFQGNNKAKYALVNVIGVGSVDIDTKDKDGVAIPLNGDNPDF
jgi:prepilin-type N-terminal cleavage/methylation domain-containing protein